MRDCSLPAIVVLALGLTGCMANTTTTHTANITESAKQKPAPVQLPPGGRPEVTIPNVSRKQVVDATTNHFVDQGFSVKAVDDYKMVFEKDGGFWLSMLAGSKFNSNAIWRVALTTLTAGDGIRIVSDVGAVTNPGSGFEQVMD